jgi:hypothetical protein
LGSSFVQKSKYVFNLLQNQLIIFTGFIIFEVCVGIFWPALSTMRGKYVPEESKLTFYCAVAIQEKIRICYALSAVLCSSIELVDNLLLNNQDDHVIS